MRQRRSTQKHHFGLFVGTIGLTQARTEIANLAYSLKRFLWIEAWRVAA